MNLSLDQFRAGFRTAEERMREFERLAALNVPAASRSIFGISTRLDERAIGATNDIYLMSWKDFAQATLNASIKSVVVLRNQP